MTGLQINALRGATQLIERARMARDASNMTEFLISAVKLVEEVIAFDQIIAFDRYAAAQQSASTAVERDYDAARMSVHHE